MAFDRSKATKTQLLERIKYLDDSNRWYIFAVDLLTQMSDIYGDANHIRDNQSILESTRIYVEKLFNFDAIAFYLISEEDADFTLSDCSPASQTDFVAKEVEKLIDAGEFAWVLNQNKAVSFNISNNKILILHVIASKTRLRGMFVGVCDTDDSNNKLTSGSLNLLSVLLHNTGYALESSALYKMIRDHNAHLEETIEQRTKELNHQCKHDNLTDLPNRILFVDRLEHAIERAQKTEEMVVVMLLDIDLFKVINDTLGHEFGDELLKLIGSRLADILIYNNEQLCLRHESDITLARFGGDEFAILIADAVNMDDVLSIANRVCTSIQPPFIVKDREMFITCSMGVSIYPNDTEDSSTLVKLSDMAMYHAKNTGRNNFKFYSDEINNISSAYLTLGNRLHQALDNDEFELYYQPQICLKTNRVIGAEALIRWFHDGKMIPPDQFIPIAEDTGQILTIGEWVIRTAANFVAKLNEQNIFDIQVAVNLSAKQFMQNNLIYQLESIIDLVGISSKQIELEITEGTIIQDIDKTVAILNQMHDLGHHLSIDDFGTGYSSLCYLKKLPVDTLKIDKSFVLDLNKNNDDKAIVKSVIALAHSLNLAVVAEGVESREHVDILKDLSCEVGQGFYFSKPIPEAEFLNFIENYPKAK